MLRAEGVARMKEVNWDKVRDVLSRVSWDDTKLMDNVVHQNVRDRISTAFRKDLGGVRAERLALQVSDWIMDVMPLVALHIDPSRFSAAEVVGIIERFLAHAPNHIVEACRLTDTDVWDEFPYDE